MSVPTPLHDVVMVEEIVTTQTPGGIWKPQKKNETGQSRIGTVVAIGPGRHSDYADVIIKAEGVELGDTVHFAGFGGTQIEHAGKTYIALNYREIFCVTKPQSKRRE